MDQAETVALGAGPGGGVRGERVRVQPLGPLGVLPGPGEQHPQGVGQRGHRTDGGPGPGRGAALLQRDGGRQPGDLADLRCTHLMDEPPGVGGDGFEVAALGLRIDRPEGQRGLAGPGHTGEDGEGVARDVDPDVPQIVLACAADPDVRIVGGGHGGGAPYGSGRADRDKRFDSRLRGVAGGRRGRHGAACRAVPGRRTPSRLGLLALCETTPGRWPYSIWTARSRTPPTVSTSWKDPGVTGPASSPRHPTIRPCPKVYGSL